MRCLQTICFLVVSNVLCVYGSSAGDLKTQFLQAEEKAIHFLLANQRDDGGFVTQEWRTLTPERKVPIDACFTVSQILYSLSFSSDNSEARRVRERCIAYLLRQREDPGVWRYRGKADRVSPDVDDTSFAWAALNRAGSSISPQALDAVRASRNRDGLFNTWVGDPSTWSRIDSREIDAVVNLNALLLFGLVHENFDPVCAYLVKQVTDGGFQRGSIYYESPLAFTLAFSRAYREGGVTCLKEAIPKVREAALGSQEKDGGWGTDYESALGLLTLLNLGGKDGAVENAASHLLARQMPDGGWALSTIYCSADTFIAGRYFYGSRAATTALCLEALAKYRRE